MSKEVTIQATSGWQMLPINLGAILAGVVGTIFVAALAANVANGFAWFLLFTLPLTMAGLISCAGHFTLQPNLARVLIMFGAYRGTVRDSGFFWMNPFMAK